MLYTPKGVQQKRMVDFNEFLEFLQTMPSIRSEGTMERYSGNVRQFLTWFKDTYDLEFSRLNRTNVKEFASYQKNIRGIKNSTVNQKISALMSFNYFLIEKGIQDDVVISKMDYYPEERKTINPAKTEKRDITQFRQRILDSNSENRIRDYAAMTLIATTGIRVSECCDAYLKDLDLYNGELFIRKGKGSKGRTVYIPDLAITALKEYLKIRKEKYSKAVNVEDQHIFVSRQIGTKTGHYGLSRQTLNRVATKYRINESITPHELRHNFITWAVTPEYEGGGGMSIEAAGAMAGHSSTRTTSIYTNPSVKKMKAKINRYTDSV